MTTEGIQRSQLSRADRALIDIVPAPIWVEDWTAIEVFCEQQRAIGVTNLRDVLQQDQALLRDLVSQIKVTAVNQPAAEFVGAESPECLLGGIPGDLLNAGALSSLEDQILVVWNRDYSIVLEINGVDMGGADIESQLNWAAPRVGDHPDYSNVVVLLQSLKEHRDAERRIRKNVESLESLLDMSRGIASTFDIETIIDLLAEATTELVDADQCWIFLFDNDAQKVTGRATHGTPVGSSPEPTYDQIMDRLPGWTMRTRQAVLSADVAADARTSPVASLDSVFAGWRAAVAPILVHDQVLGAIAALREPEREEFTETNLSLVKMLAVQAAVAIQNASLYEELRTSRDIIHASHEELKNTQTQLLGAQKMEAIGALAAGIAHEINTPIQFVSDNITFVKDALGTLLKYAGSHIEIIEQLKDHPKHGEHITELRKQWEEEDCDFLLEELPGAIEEAIEGATRVADIVKAMKEFAHPGQEDLTPSDINRIIETTVQVSRNEWKYVAEIELDLDPTLPMVPALPGPLGQSLLIMIVNSAQAMADQGSNKSDKGLITISTKDLGQAIEIRVSDNGPGIPIEILDRIFEPFFTTKEIGKGSGQGLSIAHSVIVDKHHGDLWAENTYPGAAFVMHLPTAEPSKRGSGSPS